MSHHLAPGREPAVARYAGRLSHSIRQYLRGGAQLADPPILHDDYPDDDIPKKPRNPRRRPRPAADDPIAPRRASANDPANPEAESVVGRAIEKAGAPPEVTKDPVLRSRRRKSAVAAGHQALLHHLENGSELDAESAAVLLFWLPGIDAPARQRALEALRLSPIRHAPAGITARWRSGDLDKAELARAGRRFLDDDATLDLRGDARELDEDRAMASRVQRVHGVLLAFRLGRMPLDRHDHETVGAWLQEIRAHLVDRSRAIENDVAEADASTLLLAARASEMWRDTAAMARPVRMALERLARVTWRTSADLDEPSGPRDVCAAARLVTTGNLRHEDREIQRDAERLLSTQGDDGAWRDGDGRVLVTTALALRALQGPRRTGPPR